jgi:hypothetical protein
LVVDKLTDFSGEFDSVLKNCGRTKKDQIGTAIMLQIGLPQIHDSTVDRDGSKPLEASILFSVSPPKPNGNDQLLLNTYIFCLHGHFSIIKTYSFCNYGITVNRNFPLNVIIGWLS